MNDYGCRDDLRNGEQLKVIKENSAIYDRGRSSGRLCV